MLRLRTILFSAAACTLCACPSSPTGSWARQPEFFPRGGTRTIMDRDSLYLEIGPELKSISVIYDTSRRTITRTYTPSWQQPPPWTTVLEWSAFPDTLHPGFSFDITVQYHFGKTKSVPPDFVAHTMGIYASPCATRDVRGDPPGTKLTQANSKSESRYHFSLGYTLPEVIEFWFGHEATNSQSAEMVIRYERK